MNDEQRAKLEANVSDWLKDHTYTELVSPTAANGTEVWRCKKPGSNNLAFDICVTRYGIAVFGDIGHLTFDVGDSYGIDFLRHDSIGYVHGKLAASCKEEWIDKDAILEIVRDCICEAMEDEGVEHPEGMSVEALIEWLKEQSSENVVEPPVDEWLEVLDYITEFDDNTDRDIVPAFDLLAENARLLRNGDLWERKITKPSDHVWRKLFYVRHAANAIMAQKAAAESAALATDYCYSMGPTDERWSDDGLAAFVSDHELAMDTVIRRGVISRRSASSFLPDASDVIEHMANAAHDDNSEFADNFPDTTKEQEAELERLLKPLQAWADRTCDVNFYNIAYDSIESYVVTAEDVIAGEAYRKTLEAEVAA